MLTIAKEDRKALEAKHGELLVLETPKGDVAFRVATESEYERFQTEHSEIQTRYLASKTMILACLVWPERDVFETQYIRAKPGMVTTLINELTEFVGLEKGSVRKK